MAFRNTHVRALVAAIIAAVCLLGDVTAMAAKGLPQDVGITGPGLSSPLQVTDPFINVSLGTASFMQADHALNATPHVGQVAYEIERDGFDHVRYYPGSSLATSYVYYEGLFHGSSEYDAHWYPVSNSGDTTVRMLLAAAGIQNPNVIGGLSPLSPATLAQVKAGLSGTTTAASNQPTPGRFPFLAWLAVAAATGLLIGAGGVAALKFRGERR
ncbi:MAG: hypothetical protein ACRDHX_09435 [Chloroflexota bacterium]